MGPGVRRGDKHLRRLAYRVVDQGLADLVGVDGHVLAVEVGLHAVTDRLVEEDPRGSGREDDL